MDKDTQIKLLQSILFFSDNMKFFIDKEKPLSSEDRIPHDTLLELFESINNCIQTGLRDLIDRTSKKDK